MRPELAKVGIINDRPDLRQALRLALEFAGVEVRGEAGTLEEGEDLVRRLASLGINVLFQDANLAPTNSPGCVRGSDGARLFRLTRDIHGERVRVVGNSVSDPIEGADIPFWSGNPVEAIELLEDPVVNGT
ncbi:MAG TPA: hypothetical protein VLG37_00670 [Candidatus Saccharimonadales bacterium]|nr:hypothetical protein [Candidatus Saccharimonadales bacterium]